MAQLQPPELHPFSEFLPIAIAMRRLLIISTVILAAGVFASPKTALADCESDQTACVTICTDTYTSGTASCSALSDSASKTACEDGYESYYVSCVSDCAEAKTACDSAATSGSDTSTSTDTSTSSSTGCAYDADTYWQAIQTCGITFAGVSQDCKEYGTCSLNDIMQVFVNISNFIVAISGSLVLIITVYGGFLWLTSQGNSEMVEKGKSAMRGSLIGLLIIFGAFAAINLLTGSLRGGTAGQVNKCELVSPADGGKAGTGYACLDTAGSSFNSDDYACVSNLCPGPKNIQCCIQKTE